jgi:predicted amidohydrolase
MSSRVAAIQMTSTQKVADNLKKAAQLIQSATADGAKLIILPEMFSLMGATEAEKLAIGEPLGNGKVQDFLADQAAKHGIWLVGGTTPLLHPTKKKLLAASCIYDAAGIQIACYNKLHLFDATIQGSKTVYQESSITAPGNSIVIVDTPIGRLGVGVCYDIRFPELFRVLFTKGAEIIAIPAAFTVQTGEAHWEVLLRARAIENFCYVVGACQSGIHPGGRQTYGHSMIADPWGMVIAYLPEGEGFITADIDREKIAMLRKNMPTLSHCRIGLSTEHLNFFEPT